MNEILNEDIIPESKNNKIVNVGIVSSGNMGIAISHLLLSHNINIFCLNVLSLRNDLFTKKMEELFLKQQKYGILSQETKNKFLKKMIIINSYKELNNCDIVIEVVKEDEDIKKDVISKIDKNLKDGAIIATNSSSISVTRLSVITKNPGNFIGMHFMYPVGKMKLVEIIRGLSTSKDAFNFAKKFVQSLDKEFAISEDFPGFIVNRIIAPMINEAVTILYEGVGKIEDIDKAMKKGTNQPMGPLELADFLGLDTVLSILNVLHNDLADNKYRPCPLLIKYVEAGWLGRKVGRGFYDYTKKPAIPTR